jgi:hypothetical protein
MSMDRIDNIWPCLSKRGMVSGDGGVMYPTNSGIAFIGAGGANLLTKPLYTQAEWLPLVPSSFIAALHDSKYYAYYEASASVSGMLILDGGNGILAKANDAITAAWNDPETGKLYVAVGIEILEWEGDTGVRRLYDWMSKEFLTLPPVNMGAVKIDADFTMTEAEQLAAQTAYDAVYTANQVRIGAASISRAAVTNSTAIVTGLATTADLYASLNVTGSGIPASTRIKSVDSATQITLTAAATTSTTPTLAFFGDPALLYGALGSSAIGAYPLGGDALADLPPLTFDSLQYSLYIGGALKFTKQVVDSKAFSLPAGYKSDTMAHRLAGNVRVYAVVAAESMLGLKGA